MPQAKKIVIIGSGLGGLSCGALLAKSGFSVVVLEQSLQAGGCLQCFVRNGVRFETGMHFVGGVDKGQTLQRLLHHLEIDGQLLFSQLDTDGYDIVSLHGKEYKIANGRKRFIDRLAEHFPDSRPDLERYCDLIEAIAAASPIHSLRMGKGDDALLTRYQLRAADEVIAETISDPLLAEVLGGTQSLYAGERGKTPFATHAFIMDSLAQGAYRVVGGSDRIAKALVATIEKYGGHVRLGCKVTRVLCGDGGEAVGVETAAGQHFAADCVISDIHPQRTLELLQSPRLRPAFRKRINSLPQTTGCFSVYLHFKEGRVPYMNHNLYAYDTDSPWDCGGYTQEDWPRGLLYMHFCHEPQPKFAQSGVVIARMNFKDVQQWEGTQTGHRPPDYCSFKESKTELLLSALERHCPGIRAEIAHCYTSTPLTYLDYTGTVNGAMYGTAKDVRLGMARRIPCRTRVPGLLQTGQNVIMHGMFGVLIGSLVTCNELFSVPSLLRDISDSL